METSEPTHAGVTIRRKNSRPSLNDLDVKLERYLGFRGGFFIEAGANDGYAQSNTYYLETELGWRGVLIEGIPELAEKCVPQRPASLVFQCALVSDDYDQETVTMHYADLMSVVDGSLKTPEAQAEHLSLGVEVQKLPGTYTLEVPARTLAFVLDSIQDAPPIDFFSLDVEGYELNVLRGMNIAKHRPRFILVESKFFDEVDEFFRANGYAFVDALTHHDYLYEVKS